MQAEPKEVGSSKATMAQPFPCDAVLSRHLNARHTPERLYKFGAETDECIKLVNAVIDPVTWFSLLYPLVPKTIDLVKLIEHSKGISDRNFTVSHQLNLMGGKHPQGDSRQDLHLVRPIAPRVERLVIRDCSSGKPVHRASQLTKKCTLGIDRLKQNAEPASLLTSLFLNFMPYREIACTNDSQHRSYCLGPTGLLLHTEEIQHSKQCPTQCTDGQKSPHHPNAGHLHALWHFKSLHVQWLLATLFPESLPSHTQHVQTIVTVVAVERPARPSSLPDARPAGVTRV